ncbi:hypothetical protein VTL71DRAFT_10581 [Oculimacula yallundae]|uniref:Uncharacterized protein n=1 Tax=Oculimacula yallundae TaxID=86028 RepID=A0ABR4CTW9_9HELO
MDQPINFPGPLFVARLIFALRYSSAEVFECLRRFSRTRKALRVLQQGRGDGDSQLVIETSFRRQTCDFYQILILLFHHPGTKNSSLKSLKYSTIDNKMFVGYIRKKLGYIHRCRCVRRLTKEEIQ